MHSRWEGSILLHFTLSTCISKEATVHSTQPEWEEKMGEVISRLRSIYERRFGSIREFSEFLREQKIDPSSPRTLHDYLNPSTDKSKPDLEWVLRVADALGLDYVELFRGGRTGWERVPTETYRVILPEDQGAIEFRVPQGWRPHMGLSFINPPFGRDVRMRVEKADEEKAG